MSVTLEFSITDTGIGIAEDKVQSVFDRFMQVSGASTRKYGGTGLGLTITRQLVELQGGSIHVKSAQNMGSVFTFYLTIQKGKPLNEQAKRHAADVHSCSLTGIEILLVEDNFINQKVGVKPWPIWALSLRSRIMAGSNKLAGTTPVRRNINGYSNA